MRILFLCSGNTCRSPMAKVIMEQGLKIAGRLDRFEIDSAAYDSLTSNCASKEAREVIRLKYGEDLLASHRPKRVTPVLLQWADLILVMTGRIKKGLPPDRVFTLKEFAGDNGDVVDPIGQGLGAYLTLAAEISREMTKIISRLTQD